MTPETPSFKNEEICECGYSLKEHFKLKDGIWCPRFVRDIGDTQFRPKKDNHNPPRNACECGCPKRNHAFNGTGECYSHHKNKKKVWVCGCKKFQPQKSENHSQQKGVTKNGKVTDESDLAVTNRPADIIPKETEEKILKEIYHSNDNFDCPDCGCNYGDGESYYNTDEVRKAISLTSQEKDKELEFINKQVQTQENTIFCLKKEIEELKKALKETGQNLLDETLDDIKLEEKLEDFKKKVIEEINKILKFINQIEFRKGSFKVKELKDSIKIKLNELLTKIKEILK